jgi:integrase
MEEFTLFRRTLKGGHRYYVRFRDGEDRGKAISTGQKTRAAATTWATRELRRRQTGLAEVPTLEAWAAPFWTDDCPYCTRRAEEGHETGYSYRVTMRRELERFVFGKPIGKLRLDKIRRDDLLKLRTEVAKSGRAVANMTMASLRIIIKEALFRGIISADPTAGIGKMTVPRRVKGILTPAELSALLLPDPWADLQEHLAFCVAAMTGMRTGEIRALTWGQVDFERKRIAVTRAVKAWQTEIGPPKSGRARTAPMPHPLELALRAALERLPSPPGPEALVLPSAKGGPKASCWLGLALREACKKIGIDAKGRAISPHSIRATVATWLVDAGADRRKIRSALGWADEAVMDKHYIREEEFDLSGLAGALESLPQ